MQKYSVFSLIKNAFSDHMNWEVAWKDPTPKKEYDVIIIGGGGHGEPGPGPHPLEHVDAADEELYEYLRLTLEAESKVVRGQL
mgnify:CR=1 FL=1